MTEDIKYIKTQGPNRNQRQYYFVPLTDKEAALALAKEYKSPVPQAFEKWRYVKNISSGQTFKGHEAEEDGSILCFVKGSSW